MSLPTLHCGVMHVTPVPVTCARFHVPFVPTTPGHSLSWNVAGDRQHKKFFDDVELAPTKRVTEPSLRCFTSSVASIALRGYAKRQPPLIPAQCVLQPFQSRLPVGVCVSKASVAMVTAADSAMMMTLRAVVPFSSSESVACRKSKRLTVLSSAKVYRQTKSVPCSEPSSHALNAAARAPMTEAAVLSLKRAVRLPFAPRATLSFTLTVSVTFCTLVGSTTAHATRVMSTMPETGPRAATRCASTSPTTRKTSNDDGKGAAGM